MFTGALSGSGCSMNEDWHYMDWFPADESCPLWIQRAGHIMKQGQRMKALRNLERNRLMADTGKLTCTVPKGGDIKRRSGIGQRCTPSG